MLSDLLFFDRPQLAERCQALGMALSLGSPEQALTVADVEVVLERAIRARGSMEECIQRAQTWKENAIKNCHRVIAEILGGAFMVG